MGLFGSRRRGGGGPIYGFTKPENFVGKRKSLADVLGDQSFQFSTNPGGPSIQDDAGAYDEALKAGEAQRTREESRAFDNILNNLQSRGIAKSGIALKDASEGVLGPSYERARGLAADFGLEKARRLSDLFEGERGRAGALNQQRLGGRLQAILGDQGMEGDIDMAQLQALIGLQEMEAANAYQQRADMLARRRGRQQDLSGLLGAGIGGFSGGLGYSLGQGNRGSV